MHIQRKRVLNATRYLAEIVEGNDFKLITPVTDARLVRAGFDHDTDVGARILPQAVGRTTRFNEQGRWQVFRDRPKELRFLGQRSWTHLQWHGDVQVEEEMIVDITRMCYPRELIPPPSLEITVIDLDGTKYFATDAFTNNARRVEANKHAINMMLELFGETEVVTGNLGRFVAPDVRTLNWAFLPPGQQPFERVQEHIARVVARNPTVARAALERQRAIMLHEPDGVYKGQGGFSDYFAYVFRDAGVALLESIKVGNALYVLDENWEEVARLTKAQILNEQLHRERIVHKKGWPIKLARALRPPGL